MKRLHFFIIPTTTGISIPIPIILGIAGAPAITVAAMRPASRIWGLHSLVAGVVVVVIVVLIRRAIRSRWEYCAKLLYGISNPVASHIFIVDFLPWKMTRRA